MAKKDYYIIEKNASKLYHGESTNFLDPKVYKDVITKLKGISYHTYHPYEDSDKVVIYIDKTPEIKLLELISYEPLTHREIMGSLFGLNIDSSLFGDIIITDNHYYIMIMPSIYNLILNEFTMVGSHKITLKEVSLSVLDNYHRQYEEITLITSSLRIDNVISGLIGTSRDSIKKKFMDDEIILNYDICHKPNYLLKESDIFSIRKHGKYKYIGINKNTKKGNYLITINKYIDK